MTEDKAHVDEEMCNGCGACLEVCPQEAIQPLVQGELVRADEPKALSRVASRPPTVRRSRPLVEAAGPALAVAGAGLLAKGSRALARAVAQWLTQPGDGTEVARTEDPSQPSASRVNDRGRRRRRRRRGP